MSSGLIRPWYQPGTADYKMSMLFFWSRSVVLSVTSLVPSHQPRFQFSLQQSSPHQCTWVHLAIYCLRQIQIYSMTDRSGRAYKYLTVHMLNSEPIKQLVCTHTQAQRTQTTHRLREHKLHTGSENTNYKVEDSQPTKAAMGHRALH